MTLDTSWLKLAIHQTTKPKHSIISQLKANLGGPYPARSMDVVHASDITQTDFCPRKWALYDVLEKKASPEFLTAALDVTFQMGNVTETLVVEEWAGEKAIGNWRCRRCNEQRTMVPHPAGWCGSGTTKHWWQYVQMVVEAPEYDVSGAIDCLFDVGTPQLMVTEIKILNTEDFDKIVVPLPEHRLRTCLYLKLIAESEHPFKDKINLAESRVLYVSRGYGRMNAEWNEILPFREFAVKRDDGALVELLQRAKELKRFRDHGLMASGICATAFDKIAKGCSVCKECFSGQYPAVA